MESQVTFPSEETREGVGEPRKLRDVAQHVRKHNNSPAPPPFPASNIPASIASIKTIVDAQNVTIVNTIKS